MTFVSAGRRSVLLMVAAMSALVMVLPSGLRSATAQTSTGTSSLTMVRQTPFVGPTGTFRIELATRGLPAGARIALTVYAQVPTRARLDRALLGDGLGPTVATTPQIAAPAPSGAVGIDLPISPVWPAPTGGAVLSNAGVYPVVVEVTGADGRSLDRLFTQIVRLPADGDRTSALSVGTIVTVEAEPTVAYDGELTLSTADAERARGVLAAVADPAAPALTLAPTPFVLTELKGSVAAVSTALAGRPVLATPWVPIDPGSLLAGGQGSLVVDEYRLGIETLTSTLRVTPDTSIAVIDGATSPQALDLTLDRGARAVVLGSSQVRSPVDGGALTQQFAIAAADGRRVAAMAADDIAAVPFAFVADPILAAHRALGSLAMVHFEQPEPGRGVALALPARTSPLALAEFLRGLALSDGSGSGSIGAAVLAPTTLASLFATTSTATDRNGPILRPWTAEDPPALGTYGAALEQARWDLRGARSLLPDAPGLVEPIDRTILASAARSLSTDARLTVLAGAERSIRSLSGSITMPSTQSVNLTSRSGDIPLSIDNSLPGEAHVRVTLSSPKLDFPDGPTLDLVLAPGSTRASIRVTARASGAFPMQVSIASADGILPVTSSRVDVRSTAISGWGLVLSVGAGLFLAVWWIRHFRHTRRARSLVDVESSANPDEVI
ncbi:MAG: hypothetical protein FGM58_02530 [Acidimicrobiia bacterium]|nr:hypothetical protein [Acidimicrobiia bacterium]